MCRTCGLVKSSAKSTPTERSSLPAIGCTLFNPLLLMLPYFAQIFQYALEDEHELLASRWEPYLLGFHLVLSSLTSLFLLQCILNYAIQKEAALMKEVPSEGIICDSVLSKGCGTNQALRQSGLFLHHG